MEQEKDILLAFSRGDTKAFDILFLRYQPRLMIFIEGFLKDEESSRDMCQDIFLHLWQERKLCSKIKSFKAYLFRTAKNSIYNYFEHSLVKDRYVQQMVRNHLLTADTNERIFAEELQEMIDLLVDRMPEQRQRVFRMSRELGMKNEDIAKKLNISKRTVENHITTALAQLRKLTKIMMLIFY